MVKWIIVEKTRKIRRKNICRKPFHEIFRGANKKISLGLTAVLSAFAIGVLFGGIPVKPVIAAAQTAVTLTAKGNEAEVALELSSGNQDGWQKLGGIKALQLDFQVSILHGEGEEYQVSFLFDEGITSSVKRFSYQEETGILRIYLSGEQNLYENSDITLGKIVVESNGSSDVTASIRVVEDSLKTVNDAFDLQEQPFSAPETAQVTTDEKQTVKDDWAYGGAAGSNMEDQKDGTEEAGVETGQSGSNEKPAGGTEPAADGGGTSEQEPLLRLVQTEKRSRFSLDHFSLQDLLADKKARVVLGVVAVAAAALILGTIIRIIHNRKKRKKKWW